MGECPWPSFCAQVQATLAGRAFAHGAYVAGAIDGHGDLPTGKACERLHCCIQSTAPRWHAILCNIRMDASRMLSCRHLCAHVDLLQACGERRRGRWVGTVSAANAKKDRHHRGDADPYGFYLPAMRWQAVVADAENDGRMRARWRLAPSGNMRRAEQSESSSIKEIPARHPAWHRCVPNPAGKSTRW